MGPLTHDPKLLAEASLCGGWSLSVALRHADALGFLLPVAESMATAAPALALDALGTAATLAYNSGDPAYRAELQRVGDLIPLQPDRSDRLWAEAVARPFTEREKALKRLRDVAGPLWEASVSDTTTLGDLTMLGATAWILDETDLSVRLLGRAMDHFRPAATAGTNCTVTQALALALFDGGAWTAAGSAAEDAYYLAAGAGAENVAVGAPILQATLRAVRGDHTGARERAAEAVRGIELSKSRSLYVRHCQALGMAAVAEGDHRTAYENLRRVFTQDSPPVPVHHHLSHYYLADLAAAAVTVAASAAPETVAGLTPQELQIAQLAAEGLTNRDMGARLHLSPRTIGFHLNKIFPKPGITGRAQLRDGLGP
ncbi:helix-turn-helix transcriptional regulator [Streptomyces sp. NPDC006430]|uniref:helix-turn-helix transcriptional regulator n=1 Tax=Streptomyces sp. NPDC006430 TaxID=3154299 RepID=UPI0033A1351E